MLSDEDFLLWCGRVGLSEEAQATIAKIRSADPARRVGGGRENVSGRYPSRKMGVTIQFESHRVELAFVYEMEHDPDVLEYYDQAPSIPLEYEAPNGRRLAVMHTPDYFVVHQSSAGWQECKQEQELEKLAQKSPHRYCRQSDGRWRCPPGDAEPPDLAADWEFLYERSIGCVGVLKQWLVRALSAALRGGAAALSRRTLESQALSVAQIEKILSEASEGEMRLTDSMEAASRLRERLGLGRHTEDRSAAGASTRPAAALTPRPRSQPGQRKPIRDVIGNPGVIHAARV